MGSCRKTKSAFHLWALESNPVLINEMKAPLPLAQSARRLSCHTQFPVGDVAQYKIARNLVPINTNIDTVDDGSTNYKNGILTQL